MLNGIRNFFATSGYYTWSSEKGKEIMEQTQFAPYTNRSGKTIDKKVHTISNLKGYLPVVGAGVAYQRYKAFLASDEMPTNPSIAMTTMVAMRSFFEAIGAGIVFLPVDLGVTAVRGLVYGIAYMRQHYSLPKFSCPRWSVPQYKFPKVSCKISKPTCLKWTLDGVKRDTHSCGRAMGRGITQASRSLCHKFSSIWHKKATFV